ncbi:hypothetical protein CKO27_20620 [Thiocystis violacea]|nr:hypothetical protein [Thiocystis violacea]
MMQDMSQATLILNTRIDYPNGVIVVQRIHRLTVASEQAPHGYVYQLHCGTRAGQTLIRFDNETGKGDHIHDGDRQRPYTFSTLA